jgi:hypothetical protein
LQATFGLLGIFRDLAIDRKEPAMKREPLFPSPAKGITPADFPRNYMCPHYDSCLDDAAEKDFYLDCSICGYKTVQLPEPWLNCHS